MHIENQNQHYSLQSFANICCLAANQNVNVNKLAQSLMEKDLDTLEPPNYEDFINLYRLFSNDPAFLQKITAVTTLVELVMLVECFAKQQGFRRYIVDLLRSNPLTFIRIVRTTDDLHTLCLLLPELHEGQDLPSSLACFMQFNTCFCEPLVNLLAEFNRGLPLLDENDSLKLTSGVRVARLALSAYGDFYFEQKLIKSIKFFTSDNNDIYSQISLSDEKVMVMLPLHVKPLLDACGFVAEHYTTERDSCSSDLMERDYWLKKVPSIDY